MLSSIDDINMCCVDLQILVCVFGADVNVCSIEDLKTPLHHAVLGNHPRVVR